MICTWTIVTNYRTISITGEGTPGIGAPNARCASYNAGYRLLKLSGDVEGYCTYADEQILSATSSNCNDPPPDRAHDCLNGGCIPKTTYNTPGIYANLAACQSGCAKNSNCTGECVSPEELAALQQAANNLQTKFCK